MDTQSKVQGQTALPCVECEGMGWLPTDDARRRVRSHHEDDARKQPGLVHKRRRPRQPYVGRVGELGQAVGNADPEVASTIAGRLARLETRLPEADRKMLSKLAGGASLGAIAHNIVDWALSNALNSSFRAPYRELLQLESRW